MFEEIFSAGFSRAKEFLERVKEYEDRPGVKAVYNDVASVMDGLPADVGLVAMLWLAKRYYRELTDDAVEYALGVAGAVTLTLLEEDMNMMSSPFIYSAVLERANDLVNTFMYEAIRRLDEAYDLIKKVEEVVKRHEPFDVAVGTVFLLMNIAQSAAKQLADPIARLTTVTAIAMIIGVSMITPESAESFINSAVVRPGVM